MTALLCLTHAMLCDKWLQNSLEQQEALHSLSHIAQASRNSGGEEIGFSSAPLMGCRCQPGLRLSEDDILAHSHDCW